nr:uncharacterized mitochondrial protein AtMg00810-like [Tanacetum cinerariifolium]
HVYGNPHELLQYKEVIDSGCSRHMTGNMSFPTDYKEIVRDMLPLEEILKEGRLQAKEENTNSTSRVNTVTLNINVTSSSGVNVVGTNINIDLTPNRNMPSLEDIDIFEDSHDDEDVLGVEADFQNLDSTFQVSHILTTRIHKGHPLEQVIIDLHLAPRTRRMTKNLEEHGLVGTVIPGTDNKDLKYCLFACFLSQMEPKKKKEGIFICQDKYVAEILKKFGFSDVKKASTPMETSNPLLKDKDGEEVDIHMYRSMIGSLMYLTSSRPDIVFVVCAYARYQVTPKVSHLHVVKRIFRYLKGQPKLAYSDSDYAGASLDIKSTTGGCLFLECRLISWQCKKQTVVATSLTEAEYVAAASGCAQVLWMQNQLLDYG